MWPNAANNAFKRAAYGLIDFYLEEEKRLRRKAAQTGMDEKLLDSKLDTMWGKVTLYNTYQLFVRMTSKKELSPITVLKKKVEGEDKKKYDVMGDTEWQEIKEEAIRQTDMLWGGQNEADLLTLYFNATDELPMNSMRRLVSNANNALKAIAGAEKMMASVYGIAITAMVRRVHV